MDTKWYDRENWYRMPEREKTLVPASLPVGTSIMARRVIVRCGYYYSYTDASIKDLNQIAVSLLSKRTGYSKEECYRIIQAMEIGHPQGLFSWTQKYRSLKGLYYDARRTWVHQQPCYDGTPADYRTFWYVDLPTEENWWHEAAWWDSPLREVLDKELRMIGQPDVEYEYGEFGSSYCVGTYFNEHGRQTLYRIASFAPRMRRENHLTDYWYVHPLDANEVKEKGS